MNNRDLAAAISILPANYNFEVHKTVWKLRDAEPPAKKVALQLPEGLLMFACVIGDIIERFTGASFVVLGDVTYGACCVDDLTAQAIGCDYLVHYGHSCLVPVNQMGTNGSLLEDSSKSSLDKHEASLLASTGTADTSIPLRTLYVFVEIAIDVEHLVACVTTNFGARPEQPITIMGTVQFGPAVHVASERLVAGGFTDVLVPQAKPLSRGETLGCTAPRLVSASPASGQADGTDGVHMPPRDGILIFVADGRFHLEAAMIHNPQLAAYRYDPYGKVLTRERYAVGQMKTIRLAAINQAKEAPRWGIILGTLGRQGNPAIISHLRKTLRRHGRRSMLVLLSEVFPAKLALFRDVDAWVQVACPRLSIDWGAAFEKPLLSPYEALVALGETEWREVYPMDYYASGSGPWTNFHHQSRAFTS